MKPDLFEAPDYYNLDEWSMPIRNWGIILNQFLTIFEKRVQL